MPISRIPRYEVRNDGAGPYAVFFCDKCDKEHRSTPDIGGTIARDLGRQALGGMMRNVPGLGRSASEIAGEDPRNSNTLTPQQLQAAWQQVEVQFRECPTCKLIVCVSDFDLKSGFCMDDSPRRGEIAKAQAEQAASALKGFADIFGLGEALKGASEAAKRSTAQMAKCAKDGTLAPAGTKFCPECGSAMVQPTMDACPKCGADTKGAKFCPECGTKIERAAAAPAKCSNCGAELKGAKFCPECGTKAA